MISVKVTGIAFAVYPVTDIPRARGFYEGTLGLKVCMEMEFAPGQWWIEYDAGPAALAITNAASPTGQTGRNSGVALEVANYDEALAALQAAGVAIVWGPNEFPVCRSFAIRDSDGNELYVHQHKHV
jgi:predicted enzyme related to lactoylglutathione lyase